MVVVKALSLEFELRINIRLSCEQCCYRKYYMEDEFTVHAKGVLRSKH